MEWASLEQEPCSLARALSVVGDRWTLLILRDCFLGVRRFDEFQQRLGVSRAIVSGRLHHLVEGGVLARERYSERPPRYEYRLTEKGLDLYPVVLAMVDWGNRHLAGAKGPPVIFSHRGCGCDFRPVMSCSACGEPVTARNVRARAGEGYEDPRAGRQRQGGAEGG